jgi:hypothetical protein
VVVKGVLRLAIPGEIREVIRRTLEEHGFEYREYLEGEGDWLYEVIEGSLVGEEREALTIYCYEHGFGFTECVISVYGEPIARVELRSGEEARGLGKRLEHAKRVLDEVRRRARRSRVATPLRKLLHEIGL